MAYSTRCFLVRTDMAGGANEQGFSRKEDIQNGPNSEKAGCHGQALGIGSAEPRAISYRLSRRYTMGTWHTVHAVLQ